MLLLSLIGDLFSFDVHAALNGKQIGTEIETAGAEFNSGPLDMSALSSKTNAPIYFLLIS